MSTQYFGYNLQIHKGWATYLGTPRIFAAIANEVDAQFTFASFDSKVGFATGGTQRNRCTCANGPAGHFIDSHTAETNTLPYFLHAHSVTRKAVALLTHLHVYRYLSIGHGGTIDAQVPVDATGTRDWASESIGVGLLRIYVADPLSTCVEDFITGKEGLQFG